jgi:hypothetical protein
MDASTLIQAPEPLYPPPYGFFIILLCFAIAGYYVLENGANMADIGVNWAESRCQPHIMPLAGLFGHDVNENFQFCLQQIIQDKTKSTTGPFAQGMSGFTGILTNLMNSANSFRVTLATLVGGILKIVSEFKARMMALMSRVKITAGRMKALMYRVYGTMFAVIYMGLSAQAGLLNFGDSFVFKFIDAFCFPPEQPIMLETGVKKPISQIQLGDLLLGGHRVTSTYQFNANGQEMVRLGSVEVSANHFVQWNGKWLMARDHPDALTIPSWSGGVKRPLICLSTDDHQLELGSYIFADYDETEKGNHGTQQWINASINGCKPDTPYPYNSYEIGLLSTTRIKTINGFKEIGSIQLGEQLSETSYVVGIQNSLVYDVCRLPSGTLIGAGSLIWSNDKEQWIRAGIQYESHSVLYAYEMVSLFVSPGAMYELEEGLILRDAMEVYSPETKKIYAEILLRKS